MGTPTLEVKFCGVTFPNPFTLASAPPTTTGEMMMRAFDAGWGAAITKSMTIDVKNTVNVTPRMAPVYNPRGGKKAKMFGLQNVELATTRPMEVWLKEIREMRTKYPDNVCIASIMSDANSPEDWKKLTVDSQNAGAQIIEINLACPHGLPEMGMGAAIGQNPELIARVTKWCTDVADVPIIVKLTAIVSDIKQAAKAAMSNGASGITAINTVDSISGVNLDSFVPYPIVGDKSTHGGLSGPAIKPLALRAVSNVAELNYPVSSTGGLWTWKDAAEFILLGSSNLQICTLVMFEGFQVISKLKKGLLNYMDTKGFDSISDFCGKSLTHLSNHSELSRDYKVKAALNPETCTKCGKCFISCRDAGYQAITYEKKENPVFLADKCDGCGLCQYVCPFNSIEMKQI